MRAETRPNVILLTSAVNVHVGQLLFFPVLCMSMNGGQIPVSTDFGVTNTFLGIREVANIESSNRIYCGHFW